jgi:hypothetical protein
MVCETTHFDSFFDRAKPYRFVAVFSELLSGLNTQVLQADEFRRDLPQYNYASLLGHLLIFVLECFRIA